MHEFDHERSRSHYDDQRRALDLHVKKLARTAQRLRRIQRAAFECAIYAWVLDRQADTARTHFDLSARAGLGIWKLAADGREDVELDLGSARGRVAVRNDLELADADAGIWLHAWLCAQIPGSTAVLEDLAHQPAELGSQPYPDAMAYLYALVQALTALSRDGKVDADALKRAMIASAPDHLPASTLPESERTPETDAVDHALYIATPVIESLFHLDIATDFAGFDECIAKHLGNHGRYWNAPGRSVEPAGMIAWPLLAMVAIAGSRGHRSSTLGDDYLPTELIEAKG